MTFSAALTAQSASSAIRHSVIATASAVDTTRTRAPRLGIRSTSPSVVRSSSAARSDCRVTPSVAGQLLLDEPLAGCEVPVEYRLAERGEGVRARRLPDLGAARRFCCHAPTLRTEP